jgi:hypothetical protein
MSVCLSVRPSVGMKQLGSHLTDFHKMWYLNVFRKRLENIQMSLKSDKNNGHFPWRPMHIYDNISPNSSKNENVSDISYRENKKKHILHTIFFLPKIDLFMS